MAKPASGKPSLIDTMPSSGGTVRGDDTSIRMLDGLDSGTRPSPAATKGRGFSWLVAALLLVVVCSASWSWWSQQSRVDDSVDRTARISAPARAVAASAVIDSPSAATIVATAEPGAPATAAASGAAAIASAPSMAASLAMPAVPAIANQAADTPSQTKPQAPSSARETRVATASKTEPKKPTRAPATASHGTATAPSNDPDVALLSAILATMTHDARAGSASAPSPQTQLTIAQLVQRCDMRGVKDAIETFECKRRICDGYWGKADACPMSLSPKKN